MIIAFLACAVLAQLPGEPMLRADDAQHVKVYYEKGRFGGWPANHGMWIWDNEIAVGYSRGYYEDLGPSRHHINRNKPEEHWLARSVDGGVTWTHEQPSQKGSWIPRGRALHGTETQGQRIPDLKDLKDPIDFTSPDFAMTLRMENIDSGASRFEYSYDHGHTWKGPYKLPNFDAPGTAARTDYIVDGKNSATVFLTAAKSDKKEGRVICVRTTDGGVTWTKLGDVGPEPPRYLDMPSYSIMPSSVRIADNELYTTLREREGNFTWISAWRSVDNGMTWTKEETPVDDCGEGNPPMLNKLNDGRLCLTYGFRSFPFSIRARISTDNGKTWGPQIVLRDDGADRDIGYVRSVQRPDGKMVTTYYINDEETGPERYIGATIWDPNKVSPITSGRLERREGF